jgi:hypothetical protein
VADFVFNHCAERAGINNTGNFFDLDFPFLEFKMPMANRYAEATLD